MAPLAPPLDTPLRPFSDISIQRQFHSPTIVVRQFHRPIIHPIVQWQFHSPERRSSVERQFHSAALFAATIQSHSTTIVQRATISSPDNRIFALRIFTRILFFDRFSSHSSPPSSSLSPSHLALFAEVRTLPIFQQQNLQNPYLLTWLFWPKRFGLCRFFKKKSSDFLSFNMVHLQRHFSSLYTITISIVVDIGLSFLVIVQFPLWLRKLRLYTFYALYLGGHANFFVPK